MDLKLLIISWLKDFFMTGPKAFLLKWLAPTEPQSVPKVDYKTMVYKSAIRLIDSLMAEDDHLQSHVTFSASMHNLDVDALELAWKKHMQDKTTSLSA